MVKTLRAPKTLVCPIPTWAFWWDVLLVSPWVLSGYSGHLPVQKLAKLFVGVIVDGHLSLFVLALQ